jgi:hypothetical protein
MRTRILVVLAVGAVLASVALAGPAGARSVARSTNTASHSAAWQTNLTILWNQINNQGGVSLLSQDFTDAGFDVYDSYLADDFAVPANLTKGWNVQGMRAQGVFFGGTGPCDSVSVAFYKDAAGLPGAQQGTTQTGAGSPSGTHTLVFPTSQKLAKGATYWASMWCTMPFSTGQGEWGWTDRTVTSGNTAAWENPQDGFATGCTTWQPVPNCFGGQNDGNDLVFALAGGAV